MTISPTLVRLKGELLEAAGSTSGLAKAAGWSWTKADRILSPSSNSNINDVEAALASVGCRLVISVKPVD